MWKSKKVEGKVKNRASCKKELMGFRPKKGLSSVPYTT